LKTVDIIAELKLYRIQTLVHDPLVSSQQAFAYAGVELTDWQDLKEPGALIIVVPHKY
jgi:UDP-N-acetyl-D-mannosaminuronate dehydrogenase